LKSREFDAAWGGISGLQLALPVAWTEASRRGHSLEQLARWMCEGPARLAGLQDRKGKLARGFDADLCVFEPERSFRVSKEHLRHKHKLTPYMDAELEGVVLATYLRGERVFDRGDFPGAPRGQELLR
jgi:allantoinase